MNIDFCLGIPSPTCQKMIKTSKHHDVQILISPKLMFSLLPSKQYWLVLYLQNGLSIRKLWLMLNQQKIEERPKMPNNSIVCFFWRKSTHSFPYRDIPLAIYH